MLEISTKEPFVFSVPQHNNKEGCGLKKKKNLLRSKHCFVLTIIIKDINWIWMGYSFTKDIVWFYNAGLTIPEATEGHLQQDYKIDGYDKATNHRKGDYLPK